ncbi:MAG TPA: hypothetical protein VGU44_04565 [Gammaproteobacteria bacterium]|nr:hypothetical protein [Gammaproteobacteria bacterium]
MTAAEMQRINSENTAREDKIKLEIAERVKAEADGLAAGQSDQVKKAQFDSLMNNIIRLRAMWLTEMRKQKEQQTQKHITAEEEAINAAIIDARLQADPNHLRSFSCPSDDIPEPAPAHATGFEGMLNGMLSKVTGAFGDGPFAFMGKLLAQIFGFIIPMISAFKEMGKKTPEELLREGTDEALNEADAALTEREGKLINQLSAMKAEPKAAAALKVYEQKLQELKTLVVDGQPVLFSEASAAYKSKILASRLGVFNEISSTIAPVLAEHEKVVAAKQRLDLKSQQLVLDRKLRDRAGDKESSEMLQGRIAIIQTEMQALEQKYNAARDQERAFADGMGDPAQEISDYFAQSAPLVAAESNRLGKARFEEKQQADEQRAEQGRERKAKIERERQQDLEQMRVSQAEEARKVQVHQATMAKLEAERARAAHMPAAHDARGRARSAAPAAR